MKVIVYVALSANGYLARPDGTEDFLGWQNWDSMIELKNKSGNLVIGRNTYEINLGWEEENNLRNLKDIRKIVVSTKPSYKVVHGFEVASSPKDVLRKLSSSDEVLVIGGGKLISSFLDEGLVDEIIINIEPALIGKGRLGFTEGEFDLRLKLTFTKEVGAGIVQNRYEVIH